MEGHHSLLLLCPFPCPNPPPGLLLSFYPLFKGQIIYYFSPGDLPHPHVDVEFIFLHLSHHIIIIWLHFNWIIKKTVLCILRNVNERRKMKSIITRLFSSLKKKGNFHLHSIFIDILFNPPATLWIRQGRHYFSYSY